MVPCPATSTTFAVPNLQGEFLRGYSSNSANSKTVGISTANIGKNQSATSIPYVTGWSASVGATTGVMGIEFATGSATNLINNADILFYNTTRRWLQPGSSFATSTGTNVYAYASRPTNTSVLYCIKY